VYLYYSIHLKQFRKIYQFKKCLIPIVLIGAHDNEKFINIMTKIIDTETTNHGLKCYGLRILKVIFDKNTTNYINELFEAILKFSDDILHMDEYNLNNSSLHMLEYLIIGIIKKELSYCSDFYPFIPIFNALKRNISAISTNRYTTWYCTFLENVFKQLERFIYHYQCEHCCEYDQSHLN